MGTAIAPRPWDLTHLQEFLPASTQGIEPENNLIAPDSHANNDHHDDKGEPLDADSLGDFSRIYKHLGVPELSAAGNTLAAIPAKDDYASDGAMYQSSTPARHQAISVGLSDGMERVEVVFASEHSDTASTERSNVANSQQKKDKKKARRDAKKIAPQVQRAALSESECDSAFGRGTPARQASSHDMSTRSRSAKLQTDYAALSEQAIKAVAEAAARMKQENVLQDTPCPKRPRAAKPDSKSISAVNKVAEEPLSAATAVPQQVNSNLPAKQQNSPPFITYTHPFPPSTQPKKDNGPPYIVKTHNLIPSSIQAKKSPSTIQPKDNGPPYIVSTRNPFPSSIPSGFGSYMYPPLLSNAVSATQVTTPPRSANGASSSPSIQPITLRAGEDRELALFFRILQDFGEDRKHLAKPSNLTTHNSDPAGIHVFVDASNIFIGFVDQLKRSRNIGHRVRVPDVNLSFDSLALLIERRRPVAKRVLVGSTPHNPAFDKAKEVGYEVSILEKVMKARELNARQIYFKEEALRSGRKSSKKPPPHKITLKGSVLAPGGSETTTPSKPQFAPPSLVEQGVDEILHLKMAESVLDTEEPGIMVLATGDAAQAEYSSGFAAMVERALKKGWSVELTSWAKNVNGLYRHKAWTAAYGERFRIIELDSYAEDLLDM